MSYTSWEIKRLTDVAEKVGAILELRSQTKILEARLSEARLVPGEFSRLRVSFLEEIIEPNKKRIEKLEKIVCYA